MHDNSVSNLLKSCDYEPISDYAVIGDCRCAALISRSGSLDWLCLPHFSAPSLFAALLDRQRGGRFLIRPRDVREVSRRYIGRSAVLETTFSCAGGTVCIVDFMPMNEHDGAVRSVVRTIECREGSVDVDVICQARPDYASTVPHFVKHQDDWCCEHAGGSVLLRADVELTFDTEAAALHASVSLKQGQRCRLVLASAETATLAEPALQPGDDVERRTIAWWKSWSANATYAGKYAEAVMRSCITLKLLACRETGAVMAAVTTSLPESFAADRNWDYRYCWLRDTSLLLQSFIDIGFENESADFLSWLLKVGRTPRLQPLYDLYGKPIENDYILDHLEGYRGRGPCRIGNTAHGQLQLDIYGELVQTAYRFFVRGGKFSDDEKQLLIYLGDAVCELWRNPDQSIWETRSEPRHYTYSKLMCWVALDRLISLGEKLPLNVDAAKLHAERDAIRTAIDTQGFSPELNSYVGYFGGTAPDASLLLMTRYRYLEAKDARATGTHDYITQQLAVDGLLYRYPPGAPYDGVQGPENLFAVCCFWQVDYLARAGEVDAAIQLFERLLALANDVGLYSEQFDVKEHMAIGNFPQAFSHAGLVTAALSIDQALQGHRGSHVAS